MRSAVEVEDSPFPEDPAIWRSTEESPGVFPEGFPCRIDAKFVLIVLSLLVRVCRPFTAGGGKLCRTLPGSSGGLRGPLIRTLRSLVEARLCVVLVATRGNG